MPSLTDKIVVVTGGNSGIGYEAALAMARHGAHVVLACRNAGKAQAAADRILEEIAATEGHGTVETMTLDVSSLQSVRDFCTQFRATHDRLNVLVNNAGIMSVPFGLTVDGIERQFETNHLGHFALTAQLFDMLKASAPARVVCVSSGQHRNGRIVPREEIVATDEKNFKPMKAYAQSKLYNVVFATELGHRLNAKGITGVTASACHPGAAKTNVAVAPSTENGFFTRMMWKTVTALPIVQDAASGALPTLYAATGPDVVNGDFYGPSGCLSLMGSPTLEEPSKDARNREFGRLLWEESERLSKVNFTVT